MKNLPKDPVSPRVVKFNFLKKSESDGLPHYFLTAFKDSDPQGYLRRFGFRLKRIYFYKEIPGKGGLSSLVGQLESKNVELINKGTLRAGLGSARKLKSGKRGILRELMEESKQDITGAVAPKVSVELKFGTLDDYPYVYCDTIDANSEEAKRLMAAGFKKGLPYWEFEVTRGRLLQLLTKMQHQTANLKIADFDTFATKVKDVFKTDIRKQFGFLEMKDCLLYTSDAADE